MTTFVALPSGIHADARFRGRRMINHAEGIIMSYPFMEGGIRLPEPSAGDRKTQVGSSHHFTGQIIVGEGAGRFLGTESHGEMNGALILSVRPETVAIFEQIAFEWFDADGVSRTHYIDLVVQQVDGRWIGYAVRPSAKVTQLYLEQLSRIKAQAIQRGFLSDFRLFTERDVDPIELFNAKLLHSVRVADPEADDVARKVVADFRGVATVRDLVEQTGLAGMGFRAIVRLIRSRHLKPVRHERIDYATEVFKVKNP